MASLIPLAETAVWEPEIHQRPPGEPLTGGVPDLANDQGFANVQAQLLANRTAFLKDAVDAINAPTALLANDGFTTLPGGLILQWQQIETSGQSNDQQIVYTLPTAFPTSHFVSVVSGSYGTPVVANAQTEGLAVVEQTLTSVRLRFAWSADFPLQFVNVLSLGA